MSDSEDFEPSGGLVVVERASGPVFEAKWRHDGRQVKRRLEPAWLERDPSGGWRARRGRMPEGFLDEKRATVRMATIVSEHNAHAREIDRVEREHRERGVTFREVAAAWLRHLERQRGAKPSTLQDYRYLLGEPGTAHRCGSGRSRGTVMATLGDLGGVLNLWLHDEKVQVAVTPVMSSRPRAEQDDPSRRGSFA